MAKVIIDVEGNDGASAMLEGVRGKMEMIDGAGRQAMIGMRSFGEAVQLVGGTGASALRGVASEAASAVDTIGDLAGAFFTFNPAVIALAAVGTGLAFVIAQMRDAEEKAKAAHEALIQPFIATREELEKLAGGNSPLLRLAQAIPTNIEQIDRYGKSSIVAAQQLLRLNDAQSTQVQLADKLKAAQVELSVATAQLSIEEDHVAKGADKNNIDYAIAKERYDSAAQTVTKLAMAHDLARTSTANLSSVIQENIALMDLQASTEDRVTRATLAQAVAFDAERIKAYNTALKNLAQAQADILKGAINSALAPTQVTDADMQATAIGKYADKWDETVRRLKTGNIDQYGKDFADRIRSLGMPLEDVTRKFQNFSLFANGENMDLINFDALNASVADQLDALIGEAKVKETAFQNVLKNMSPDKQNQLQELGIMKLSDADKVILKAKKADDFDAVLKDAQKTLLDTFPKEMSTTIFATWAFGKTTTNQGTSGLDLSGGAGAKGNQYSNIMPEAEGGYGIARQGQMFMADAGEAYWFSGKDHTVPPPSSASSNITLVLDGQVLARIVAGKIQGKR